LFQRFQDRHEVARSGTDLVHRTNDLVEASFLDRCKIVMECIGRLRFQTPRGRSYATGFLIAPGFVMTNHHVFPNGVAARGAVLEFGYRFNVAGQLPTSTETFDLAPEQGYFSDSVLDFAVVAVAPRSGTGRAIEDRRYLRLIPETGKAKFDEFVTIIQHPDGDPMQIALRENRISRLEADEPFLWYQADTAHGSSGAPVFNDSFQPVALHASGRIKRDAEGRYARVGDRWVASLDGVLEKVLVWEANVGFRVSRICAALLAKVAAERADLTPLFEAAMRGGDCLSAAVASAGGRSDEAESKVIREPDVPEQSNPNLAASAGASLVIPLQLRVTLELPDAATGAVPAIAAPAVTVQAGPGLEAFEMRIPVIYDGLDQRPGFEKQYLASPSGEAPMAKLTAQGDQVAAPLLDGSGVELKYRHFSVWMHKDRRLALLTASNVDWRGRKRFVDGKSTSRDALAGFPPGKTLLEQWVSDPRIDPRHQLADIFFTEDKTKRYTSKNPPPGWPAFLVPALDQIGGLPGLFTYQNFGRTTQQGFEVGVEGSLNRNVGLFANYAFQAKPDVNFDLSEVNLPSKNRFNTGFNFNKDRYIGNLVVTYAGSAFWQDVLNDPYHGTTKAYTMVNGGFGVTWAHNRLTTSLKANNIGNAEVQQHVFGDIIKRSVIGELRVNF